MQLTFLVLIWSLLRAGAAVAVSVTMCDSTAGFRQRENASLPYLFVVLAVEGAGHNVLEDVLHEARTYACRHIPVSN